MACSISQSILPTGGGTVTIYRHSTWLGPSQPKSASSGSLHRIFVHSAHNLRLFPNQKQTHCSLPRIFILKADSQSKFPRRRNRKQRCIRVDNFRRGQLVSAFLLLQVLIKLYYLNISLHAITTLYYVVLEEVSRTIMAPKHSQISSEAIYEDVPTRQSESTIE
jgi:hypothetical protein